MALIGQLTKPSGAVIDQSYAVIRPVTVDKTTATARINYYASQDLYQAGNGADYLEDINFVPSVADDAPNSIKQAYEYAKTLPKFAEFIDA